MSSLTKLSGTLLTSDNKKIAYKHYKRGHGKVIVIAHGFYNSKDALLLEELAGSLDDNHDVFMFDFRGHGKSSGLYYWTSKERHDLKAALGYLQGKYNKIGLVAFSLGGAVAINLLAKERLVDSLVCVSVPSEFDKIDYKFWELDLKEDLLYTLFTKSGRRGRGFRSGPFWLKKEKPIDNIGKLNIPVLFIHGEKDWVVGPWHSEKLFAKATALKKNILIKGGSHAEYLMRGRDKSLIREIRDWFSGTLK